MSPLDRTPFFSPRNVPLWAGLVMAAIFAAALIGRLSGDPAVDHDSLMQVLGLVAVIGPTLALGLGLAIASRRRQAAERADFAEPPPAAD